MRQFSIFSKTLLSCFLAVMIIPAFAQNPSDSAYKVNDTVSVSGRPHNVNTSFDMPGVSFFVDYNYNSARKGGLTAVSDGYFHGQVTIKPHMRADTANHILNVALEVHGDTLEGKDGGEGFGMIYGDAVNDVTAAQLNIVRIKVYLGGERDTVI